MRVENVAIRVEARPGEIVQVDFGFAGQLFDPDQGVMRRALFFMMGADHDNGMWAVRVCW